MPLYLGMVDHRGLVTLEGAGRALEVLRDGFHLSSLAMSSVSDFHRNLHSPHVSEAYRIRGQSIGRGGSCKRRCNGYAFGAAGAFGARIAVRSAINCLGVVSPPNSLANAAPMADTRAGTPSF